MVSGFSPPPPLSHGGKTYCISAPGNRLAIELPSFIMGISYECPAFTPDLAPTEKDLEAVIRMVNLRFKTVVRLLWLPV